MSSEPHSEPPHSEGNKRKSLDDFEVAKQKAQEIAARLSSDVESKRAKLDSHFSSPPSNHSFPTPYFDNAQKFQSQPAFNQQGPKKISIPNGKVGVIIGKGGETIKHLQLQSGARIQITKDSEADPYATTRDVELVGTQEQINKAEQLIADVIAEADAGGPASSAVHGIKSAQPGAEQVELKVPNTKVALLIGKGGETIKTIQSRSGARMQIVPLRLPPGDTSTERSVFINGSKEQIDSAQEMVNEIVNEGRLRNPPGPSGYMQQPVYNPSGNWAPPAQTPVQQQPGYGYTAPGAYPAAGSYYGNYQNTQQAGWDQSNPVPPQQSTGYNYYAQQDQTGSAPPNYNYGYSQTPPISSQGYSQGYSQQPPSYGQAIPSQVPSLDQQNPYAATPGYGSSAPSSQPYGTTPPAQSTQSLPPNPVGYSQPMATPQAGYGTWQGYSAPQPVQPGYDQTGSAQTGYGAQQPGQVPPPLAALPPYGQSAYPQPAVASSNYPQGTNPPVYGQQQFHPPTHSQPPTRGVPQLSATGAESNGDGNSAPAYGSSPAVQESARS